MAPDTISTADIGSLKASRGWRTSKCSRKPVTKRALGQVGDGDHEIVVYVADPGREIGAPLEVAALGLVVAPVARHGPDRPIPVFLDGHRPAGDRQEFLAI